MMRPDFLKHSRFLTSLPAMRAPRGKLASDSLFIELGRLTRNRLQLFLPADR